MESEAFKNVLSLLNKYAEEYKKRLKDTLESNDRKATGQLIRNIETIVKIGTLTYTVTLQCADYLYWIDKGRNKGKYPPIDKILEWIHAKPIKIEERNGVIPTEKQLAFLIARKIALSGYTGTHDLTITNEELNAKYVPLLQDALRKDFEEYWSIAILDDIQASLSKAFKLRYKRNEKFKNIFG